MMERRFYPVFGEIAKSLDAVQHRAFDLFLFEKRGREVGHELDDWLRAEHELFGWPAAELSEKDSSYQMQIALPGFEARDIELTATPTELIVHAASEKQNKTEKTVFYGPSLGPTTSIAVSKCRARSTLIRLPLNSTTAFSISTPQGHKDQGA
jgi:hypothetical protein